MTILYLIGRIVNEYGSTFCDVYSSKNIKRVTISHPYCNARFEPIEGEPIATKEKDINKNGNVWEQVLIID